jgi:hypothetical protein
MKIRSKFRVTKLNIATSMLVITGLCGFAAVAISAEEQSAVAASAADSALPQEEISNGSLITLDGGVAIAPIPGWRIERKAMGMGLVMKEVLPEQKGANIDYSTPIFARNITLTTLPEARYMDEQGVEEAKADIAKMIARDPSLKDFTITEAKSFDYKSKNDGVVIFSQLTVNNYQMMQMQVIVSGDKKAYLLTYSDIATNFANPASYDAAWKSMTSIVVPGEAPKRFEKEIFVGGSLAATLLALVVPFFLARRMSSRRIRKLAEELQHDWDRGAVKTDSDYDLSDIVSMTATRPALKFKSTADEMDHELDSAFALEGRSLTDVSNISTRHSRFA